MSGGAELLLPSSDPPRGIAVHVDDGDIDFVIKLLRRRVRVLGWLLLLASVGTHEMSCIAETKRV